ncbi:MAG: serine/threonine protein phosphatase [Methanosphaera stadtmanae]|nr:serine/threonine protein phosphatase [Methanosphaera stadtmanae]
MKNKIKNFCIPLILMIITNLGNFYITNAPNFGGEINPHLGILFIGGLFFGPYGSLGAAVGNFFCDIIRGYSVNSSITSLITSFLISYLAFKLWYTKKSDKFLITRPRLNNSRSLVYLMILIMECGFLYSVLTMNEIGLFYHNSVGLNIYIGLRYFVNFINFALIFSIICILICRFKDFSYKPEISEKSDKNYRILHHIILIFAVVNILIDIVSSKPIVTLILIVLMIILLIVYIRKPIKEINTINYIPIPERITNYFIILTIFVLLIDMLLILSPVDSFIFQILYDISANQQYLIALMLLDGVSILFFIPALILLTYMEGKVINPIKSFSHIESFIKKDKRIESEGILEVYSEYIEQDDEIGILSRSYTKLIKNNNEYIDNLKELESEKQRIKAELNIAHNIQQTTLPLKAIDNEYIYVNGYCKPAKEVGGDFYDFYEIDDDNTILIIGDASGKGVPAAIFTILTQTSIKILLKNELNPANVLYDVNNQICEDNPEMMFITLFLAIYNNKTHKLTYANAGHNPPIIKKETGYEFLEVDSEIVMGIMEEYTYTNHEVQVDDKFILYTDGVTDAQNSQNELYGEERLINCLNNITDNDNIINGLITDIRKHRKDEEQFDDATILTLNVKK